MLPIPGLRRHRLARFMSQADLSEQSGVGEVTISRLENGQPARLSTIRKLAAALAVEPAALFDDGDGSANAGGPGGGEGR